MRIRAILDGRGSCRRASLLFLLFSGLAVSPVALAQTVLTDRVQKFVPVYLPVVASPDAPAPQTAASVIPAAPEAPVPAVAPVIAADLLVEVSVDAPLPPQPVVAPDVDVDFTFSNEVANGRISSVYGRRPSRPAGSPVMHHGVDIASPTGSPVYAAAEGTIIHAENGYNDHEAWGNTVVIDHGEGWQTFYAHLHDIDVEVGQRVSGGQEIGGMGATGRATGSHLHVEVRRHGERLDPAEHIPGLRKHNH